MELSANTSPSVELVRQILEQQDRRYEATDRRIATIEEKMDDRFDKLTAKLDEALKDMNQVAVIESRLKAVEKDLEKTYKVQDDVVMLKTQNRILFGAIVVLTPMVISIGFWMMTGHRVG